MNSKYFIFIFIFLIRITIRFLFYLSTYGDGTEIWNSIYRIANTPNLKNENVDTRLFSMFTRYNLSPKKFEWLTTNL